MGSYGLFHIHSDVGEYLRDEVSLIMVYHRHSTLLTPLNCRIPCSEVKLEYAGVWRPIVPSLYLRGLSFA